MTSKLSIRQISVLTALDRDTVTRRLQGLPSEPGTKNARMYDSSAALRAVLAPALLAPGESTLEQVKVRTETLNAKLKEVELAKKTKDLIRADFSLGLVETFIKYCAHRFETLRLRGAVVLLGFARLELSSNVREPGRRLIRSLRSLTLAGLRLCRSIPVGSIPAGNGFHDFTSLNAIGTCVSTVSY